MLRYPKPIRWIARLMGRMIIYLSEVISVPQRKYNQALLQAMRDALELFNSKFSENLNGIEEHDKKISEHDKRITEHDKRITEHDKRITEIHNEILDTKKTISYLKTNLVYQERSIHLLLEEARKCLPESFGQDQLESLAKEESHLQDPYYVSFEDQFRGTREDIKERLKAYIPLIKVSNVGTSETPILDIGCGRGEWLEILKELNLEAMGLDINRVLIDRCRQNGLNAVEADAIAHLRKCSAGTIGAITGFHIIEHFEHAQLIKLIEEAVRVLKPGGIVIFETPNPKNIMVGACNFYADPTHIKPLFPDTMKFFFESMGFFQVEIRPMHPVGEEHWIKETDSEIASRFNTMFYGPQDYALIGMKP